MFRVGQVTFFEAEQRRQSFSPSWGSCSIIHAHTHAWLVNKTTHTGPGHIAWGPCILNGLSEGESVDCSKSGPWLIVMEITTRQRTYWNQSISNRVFYPSSLGTVDVPIVFASKYTDQLISSMLQVWGSLVDTMTGLNVASWRSAAQVFTEKKIVGVGAD